MHFCTILLRLLLSKRMYKKHSKKEKLALSELRPEINLSKLLGCHGLGIHYIGVSIIAIAAVTTFIQQYEKIEEDQPFPGLCSQQFD